MKHPILRSLCLPVAAMTFVTAGPMQLAQAAMVPTEQVLAPAATGDIAQQRERLGAFMTRDDVRSQMMGLGVDADEAAKRVAALSDAEVSRLAGHLQAQPAGGSVIGILLIVLIVVAIVFMVRRV